MRHMTLGDLYKEWYYVQLYPTEQTRCYEVYSKWEEAENGECISDCDNDAELFTTFEEAETVAKRIKQEWKLYKVLVAQRCIQDNDYAHIETLTEIKE